MIKDSEGFDPAKYPSLELGYQELRYSVERQLDRVNAIDSKIGMILGFTGVVLSILLSSQISDIYHSAYTSWWPLLVYFIAIVLVFVSAVLNIIAYRNQKYGAGPKPDKVFNIYMKKNAEWVKARISKELILAYEYNQNIIEKKVKRFRWALYFLFSGLVLTIVPLAYRIIMRWC